MIPSQMRALRTLIQRTWIFLWVPKRSTRENNRSKRTNFRDPELLSSRTRNKREIRMFRDSSKSSLLNMDSVHNSKGLFSVSENQESPSKYSRSRVRKGRSKHRSKKNRVVLVQEEAQSEMSPKTPAVISSPKTRLKSDMRVNTSVGGSFSRAFEEADTKTPLAPKKTPLLFKEKDMQIQSPISKVIVEENNSEQTPKVGEKRLSIKQKEESKEENQVVSVSDSSVSEAEALLGTKVEITKTRTVVSSQKTHDQESKDSNIAAQVPRLPFGSQEQRSNSSPPKINISGSGDQQNKSQFHGNNNDQKNVSMSNMTQNASSNQSKDPEKKKISGLSLFKSLIKKRIFNQVQKKLA